MAGPYPGVRVQIQVCLIRVVSTYSNGAVQFRVSLELLEDWEVRNLVVTNLVVVIFTRRPSFALFYSPCLWSSLRIGSSQTWLFQTWLLQFLRGGPLLRSFIPFNALFLLLRSFVLFCAHLRASVSYCA